MAALDFVTKDLEVEDLEGQTVDNFGEGTEHTGGLVQLHTGSRLQ